MIPAHSSSVNIICKLFAEFGPDFVKIALFSSLNNLFFN